MKTCITAARLFTPTEVIEHPLLIIEDRTIESVSSRRAAEAPTKAEHLDFPDLVLAPGYIDIHVHGGAGHDVMQDDPAGRAAFERALAKHGVTSYLATTVTAPLQEVLGALDRLAKVVSAAAGGAPRVGAQPLGIHLEGPFISPAKCGVHPPEYLVAPSVELFEQFWQASGGRLRMMTIAPELPEAAAVISEAVKRGVHSSIGHSDATYEETVGAIDAGATHATHTFNAMRALDHREPGILGAVLSSERLMADIIADGVHVAPPMVKLFLNSKGPQMAVLISDAISATGMPDGMYRLGSFQVEVRGDRCEVDGRLAGSVLSLDRAVRNVMDFAEWNLRQSIVLATRNPASLLGASSTKGVIAPGRDADLVVLSPAGEVVHTFLGGRLLQH